MVEYQITLFAVALSLAVIGLGFYIKKKGYYMCLSGSVILLILGISLFISPLAFAAGVEANTNISVIGANETVETYTENTVYASQNMVISNIITWVILLLGIAGIAGSIQAINNLKYEEED